MIIFRDTAEELREEQLCEFFVGWPDPPNPATHLRILQGSTAVELALDEASDRVIGFVTAITDGTLVAYIPLLEVLTAYQGQGFGTMLVRRMLARLKGYYMVDLLCDERLRPFYERVGMMPVGGMCARHYQYQSGISAPGRVDRKVG